MVQEKYGMVGHMVAMTEIERMMKNDMSEVERICWMENQIIHTWNSLTLLSQMLLSKGLTSGPSCNYSTTPCHNGYFGCTMQQRRRNATNVRLSHQYGYKPSLLLRRHRCDPPCRVEQSYTWQRDIYHFLQLQPSKMKTNIIMNYKSVNN